MRTTSLLEGEARTASSVLAFRPRHEAGVFALPRVGPQPTEAGARGAFLLTALRPGLQARFGAVLDEPLTGQLADLLGRLDDTPTHGTR